MALRIIIGLVLTAIAAAVAGRRLWWLFRLGRTGQPAPERVAALREHPAQGAETQVTQVIGQRKLLQWSVPGVAHALTFWGFLVLILTIIEAYGALFSKHFAIPLIGTWAWVGFVEDLFAVGVLVGIITFAIIRLRNDPKREGRESRFSGSHTGAAWLVLLGIFLVIATLLVSRGAQINTGDFPYPKGAFASEIVGHWLHPAGAANMGIETSFILLQLAVILAFGIFVTYSKHLHIAIAPVNVLFARRPGRPRPAAADALERQGARLRGGRPGRGRVRHRQGRGPQLEGPAGPGDLHRVRPVPVAVPGLHHRQAAVAEDDHPGAARSRLRQGALPAGRVGRGPRRAAGRGQGRGRPADRRRRGRPRRHPSGRAVVVHQLRRVRRGVPGRHRAHRPHHRACGGIRSWSSPRSRPRPATMLRNLENKGDPWGMGGNKRTEWITELDFEVPVVDGPIGDDVEYLFWVGCAGALEDRAKKTTKAVAQLLHTAGVSFAVLGAGESCTGDPARRMGNEFVFSMLAQQNVETLNEAGVRKIVASCPHCFNTISREYPQLGGNYEVIHHTQLLARLVAEGRLTPVTPIEEKITYHDPCFLGRHNRVFTPPREIMEQVPGVQAQEMHRCKERGFCCGAGGARMWMEETHRQADQHRADRRGAGHRPGHDLDRLPVLPGDARRRGRGEEELRRGQGVA